MEIRRLSRVGFCPQIEVNCSSSYSLLLTIFAEACKSNQCCSSSSSRRKERKKWMKKKPDLIADSPGFSAENQRSAVLKLLGIEWSLAGNAGQVMILGQYSSLFSCSSSFLAEAQKREIGFDRHCSSIWMDRDWKCIERSRWKASFHLLQDVWTGRKFAKKFGAEWSRLSL